MHRIARRTTKSEGNKMENQDLQSHRRFQKFRLQNGRLRAERKEAGPRLKVEIIHASGKRGHFQLRIRRRKRCLQILERLFQKTDGSSKSKKKKLIRAASRNSKSSSNTKKKSGGSKSKSGTKN